MFMPIYSTVYECLDDTHSFPCFLNFPQCKRQKWKVEATEACIIGTAAVSAADAASPFAAHAALATTFAAAHATFQVATGTSSDTVGRASDARYLTGATGATGAAGAAGAACHPDWPKWHALGSPLFHVHGHGHAAHGHVYDPRNAL